MPCLCVCVSVRLTDELTCSELRQRLGVDDIITVVQWNGFRWYGLV